jgi:predicted lactoylglutathione lyase
VTTKIFVNLPVKDLDRTKEFFGKLGFTFNAQFTNGEAACMVISEDIYAMLVTRDRFKDFTNKEIADATRTTEVLTTLALQSRAKVDEMLNAALKAGGTEARPAEDHCFMYGRSFNDPDGHIWEVFYMDPSAIQKA